MANYSGDVLNFNVAQKRCQAGRLRSMCGPSGVTDDVASAPPDEK
jgi:dihydroxyacetone kinase